jgi:negative regulator of flagellin synthesis FlgM
MKISQSDLSVNQSPASTPQKASAQPPAPSSTATASTGAQSAGVAVTVSNLARGLEKAGRSEGADVDTKKVAAVRASIQEGTYVVNAEAIADKLLSNAQDMLKPGSK